MKHRVISKLLSLLLVLCLVAGSFAALAEETFDNYHDPETGETVTNIYVDLTGNPQAQVPEGVSPDANAAVDVSRTEDYSGAAFNSDPSNIVNVGAGSGDWTINVQNVNVEPEASGNKYAIHTDSKVGNLTLNVDGSVSNTTEGGNTYGIVTNNVNGSGTAVTVTEGVAVNNNGSSGVVDGVWENAYGGSEASVTVGGDVAVTSAATGVVNGVRMQANDGTVELQAKDITATSTNSTTTTGAYVEMRESKATLNAEDIEVKAEGPSNVKGLEIEGLSDYYDEPGKTEIAATVGSITAEAGEEAYGKDVMGLEVNLGKNAAASVTVNGDISAMSEGSEYIWSSVYGVNAETYYASGSFEGNVKGNVTARRNDANVFGAGLYSGGNDTLNIGGNVQATGTDNVYGIVSVAQEADTTTALVTVGGDIFATATGLDGEANGVYVGANHGGSATAIVAGDVTGLGDGAVGVSVEAQDTAAAKVVVDGTVAGTKVAIQQVVTETSSATAAIPDQYTGKADYYIWEAKANGSGEIAQAIDRNYRENADIVDAQASTALEAAINYIIHVASAANNAVSLGTVQGTLETTIYDATYKTAHEGEEVTFTLEDYEDGDELEVYYNGERGEKLSVGTTASATAYTIANKVVTVLMQRGGAMSLLANIKKAQKQEETEPEKTEPETTEPEKTEPEKTEPEKAKPEETKPEEAKPTESAAPSTAPTTAPTEAPVVAATPIPAPAEAATTGKKAATPQYKLVWIEIPEANGVKSADGLAAGEAATALGGGIAGATVELVDSDKLVPAADRAAFDALPVADRVGVALALLGCGEDGLSDEAAAVLESVKGHVDALSEADKAARQAAIDGCFQPRLVVVDGAEQESVGLELKLTQSGSVTRERFTFIGGEGGWKLYRIEKGAYVEA